MKDCPRCHGSGEIGWNDSPISDPQCAQEATCNVCHGEGVVMSEDPIGDRDEAVMAKHFETLEARDREANQERVGDLLVRAEAAEAQRDEERELRRAAMDRVEELEVALEEIRDGEIDPEVLAAKVLAKRGKAA